MSLVELLFAIAVLSVALVSLLGVFTVMINATSKSTGLSAGVLFAERRLEEAAAKGSPTPIPEFGSEGIYTHDSASGTRFYYSLRSTHLCDSAGPGLGQAWLMEVEVYWWSEDPDQMRAGMGRTATRVGRIIYVPAP
jgi:type II secretory pathway pseudopilin PulG